MDRSASKSSHASKRSQAPRLRPDQVEVFDGLLLALLARKRLLLLVGEPGSGRTAVFQQLVEYVASDGALVLPVAASPGAQVEDLVGAAGDAVLPSETGERDFDTLIEELEQRLDLAGAGLLAVDNAGVLAAPTLADLIDLSRSETTDGRFLQVLLCGTPEMERTLARPGLAEAVRDLGVIYRMAPRGGAGAVASVVPVATPMAAPLTAPPPAPEPKPTVDSSPANDWDVPDDWTGSEDAQFSAPHMPPPPRRRAALAGAAVTTLILLGAAGAAVTLAIPDATPERALETVKRGWTDLRAYVDEHVTNPFTPSPPELSREPDALALARLQNPYLRVPVTPAESAQPPLVRTFEAPPVKPDAMKPDVMKVEPVKAEPPPPLVAKPDIPPPTPPITPPVVLATPPVTEPPPPAESGSNSAVGTGTATLPPLVEETPTTQVAALPSPSAPLPEMDGALTLRVRALVDQARRQISAKRLTTPPGDNAYETVSRLREIAPTTPEIPELLAVMEDTYRRWAAMAERDGDFSEARRFYERALIVAPDNGDLRDRIKSAGERRMHADLPQPMPEAEPGLDSREAIIALLRRPAELKRVLDGGADPNKRVDNGKTLLMLAAEQGLTDAVRVLLDRRARTELKTSDGATAVMYAAWGGHEGVIQALASAGAELDATNDDGKTALMAASARGHANVVRALIDHGVAVDRVAGHGWSALMYAANNGHDRVARLLVERGANPFRMDTAGNSALTLGALQGHVQVVEALKPR
ncbi:ankyrin repeat domain-containing protein [Azospirillum soli]|uniref:ankyrin repeat domain-containing protein n=1 Tax=Azospirillum soli TaxID=1304799 RepID=UPI001AE2A501|nr:ankyrin repeat domain-containing protein [Azospirillum soli]MBP2311106.1 hypothetical protein [Azospirillum soli]